MIGGAGAFALPVRSVEGFAEAIRRKLVLEVSGYPPGQIVPASADTPADCLAGEKARKIYTDRYYPGLDN